MSENSLPFFGDRGSLRRRAGGLLRRVAAKVSKDRRSGEPAVQPELERSAETHIQGYLAENATLVERAGRLTERQRRLEAEGLPAESVSLRAERARGEVMAGLVTLRDSFATAVADSAAGRRAFDRSLERLCPAFAPAAT